VTHFQTPPEVLEAEVEDGRVLLNQRTGLYHRLNRTGGRVVEALRTGDSLESIASMISSETGQPFESVQNDLEVFVKDLSARGLLISEAPE
jgi:hypothetical protein